MRTENCIYYTKCAYSQCMPHTHLHNLWTNTCGLVGVARTFGLVGHACATNKSVKSVRRQAKRTHYVERVWECEHVFEPHRTQRYGCFSRRPCTLFASLGAAALSCTHRSRRRLHSVEAAFTLCLLLRFHARLLALSSSLPSQLLPFWCRDNETASAIAVLRTIKLLCIPEPDKLHSWAWQIAFLSVTPHPSNREHVCLAVFQLYVFAVYASLVHLNNLWTNTCGLVSRCGTCFWDCQSMHVQRSVKSVRRAKCTYYVERVSRIWVRFRSAQNAGYCSFSRWPRTLFAMLGAAGLSRTHRSRCRLHGVVVAFMLSVFSSVFVPGS